MQLVKNYKLTVLCTVGILIAILMPGSDVPSVGIPNIDKAVHFCMFGVLAGCYNWEYDKQHKKMPSFWKSSLKLITFGAATELMQYFVPGRSCDIMDLAADSLGILLISYLMSSYKTRK